jgi:CubicO group peptidase (beta-lactamase class C family)
MAKSIVPVRLLLLLLIAAFPAQAQPASQNIGAKLAEIDRQIEAKRIELGVQGAALAVVVDDKVALLRGYGFKDAARNLPVTPDTVFQIGSTTKAFTGVALMMSVEGKKVSLADHPRKFVSYFKLKDADADKAITILDLVTHRSGLARTDLAWYSGQFTREEVIRLAGLAKPLAKIGQAFHYQNVMYSVAGEVIAAANRTSYEAFLAERILKPLGMTSSTARLADFLAAKDRSDGFEKAVAGMPLETLQPLDVDSIAAGGSLNSTARDLGQWVRFLAAGGEIDGVRLLTRESFATLIAKHQAIAPGHDYGLGWILRDWNGEMLVEHGGNVDGFSAQVAFLPGRRIGFALLTNQNASAMTAAALDIVLSQLAPAAAPVSAPKPAIPASVNPPAALGELIGHYEGDGGSVEIRAAGAAVELVIAGQPPYRLASTGIDTYSLEGLPQTFVLTLKRDGRRTVSGFTLKQPNGTFEFVRRMASPVDHQTRARLEAGTYFTDGFKLDITHEGGALLMRVAGQPDYALQLVEGRRYKLGGAPAGFFVTFRPARAIPGRTEAFLEQKPPQPNLVLLKKDEAALTMAADKSSGIFKELVGLYEANGGAVEITLVNDRVSLVVAGQDPYPLSATAKDKYSLGGLANTYMLEVQRGANGAVSGFVLRQPNGTFPYTRATHAKADISLETLMARALLAVGGEAELRKVRTLVMSGQSDFVHQGLAGEFLIRMKTPNLRSVRFLTRQFGTPRQILHEYCNASTCGLMVGRRPGRMKFGKELEEARMEARIQDLLDWRTNYKSPKLSGPVAVDGEQSYLVEYEASSGGVVREYYSAKTYLLVRRETSAAVERFGDFREVGGLTFPFETRLDVAGTGEVVNRTEKIEINPVLNDAEFRGQ